jgi:hypothetical protein
MTFSNSFSFETKNAMLSRLGRTRTRTRSKNEKMGNVPFFTIHLFSTFIFMKYLGMYVPTWVCDSYLLGM